MPLMTAVMFDEKFNSTPLVQFLRKCCNETVSKRDENNKAGLLRRAAMLNVTEAEADGWVANKTRITRFWSEEDDEEEEEGEEGKDGEERGNDEQEVSEGNLDGMDTTMNDVVAESTPAAFHNYAHEDGPEPDDHLLAAFDNHSITNSFTPNLPAGPSTTTPAPEEADLAPLPIDNRLLELMEEANRAWNNRILEMQAAGQSVTMEVSASEPFWEERGILHTETQGSIPKNKRFTVPTLRSFLTQGTLPNLPPRIRNRKVTLIAEAVRLQFTVEEADEWYATGNPVERFRPVEAQVPDDGNDIGDAVDNVEGFPTEQESTEAASGLWVDNPFTQVPDDSNLSLEGLDFEYFDENYFGEPDANPPAVNSQAAAPPASPTLHDRINAHQRTAAISSGLDSYNHNVNMEMFESMGGVGRNLQEETGVHRYNLAPNVMAGVITAEAYERVNSEARAESPNDEEAEPER
ncbi:hypothetical protein DE146DRAFT_757084 [Phaeosphaeria sp. MPI-PUGE-AT-0046c]|nr:hypothetical protein DE146DRAFT_757084 [Phaeosphaeria sp. MPI-PUGE-AT-0046c]